ncbi:hypothetical protein HQ590_12640 [bacterium]|nr:hypothetical protein [bacterium]
MKLVIVLLGCLLVVPAARAAPRPFLVLKTGERFATQEIAAPTVAGLTAWLGEKLAGGTNAFAPHVFNDPKAAVEFCARTPPVAGIVTPGFYLTYAQTLDLEPVLETQRQGVPADRFVLVARQDTPGELAAWAGKSLVTTLAAEEPYVLRVILEGKLGRELRLQPTTDVEGSLLDLAEGSAGAADLVLVEEAAWEPLAADPELAAKLRVLFRSADLPHELVVVIGAAANALDPAKLGEGLQALGEDEAGRRVLASIRVRAFEPVDQQRLNRARELFHGK